MLERLHLNFFSFLKYLNLLVSTCWSSAFNSWRRLALEANIIIYSKIAKQLNWRLYLLSKVSKLKAFAIFTFVLGQQKQANAWQTENQFTLSTMLRLSEAATDLFRMSIISMCFLIRKIPRIINSLLCMRSFLPVSAWFSNSNLITDHTNFVVFNPNNY